MKISTPTLKQEILQECEGISKKMRHGKKTILKEFEKNNFFTRQKKILETEEFEDLENRPR